MIGQALGLIACPGLEGGDKPALVDQAILNCEQSEQQMAVGGGHDKAPIVVGRAGEGTSLSPRPVIGFASEQLSQVRSVFASVADCRFHKCTYSTFTSCHMAE